jgi:hypothetical protein
VVHPHRVKTLQTGERLTNVVVSNELIGLEQEQDMVFNHRLLQDKFVSCKSLKYIGSFAVILLILSLAIFSTWMIVASVRCDRVAMANNIPSVVMIVLQMIVMRQVHRTEFRDREQAGWPIPSLSNDQ